ncbi:MAG: hypothetical protein SH848_20540 [Saprospiraceae bacterium]|mgnify:CR=1 FL=1|nr:hypothetical protein [Saprospiraceae bacterium]MDZ4706330.1 hypothetical protein [Saprospiraceae bacterium]
MSADNAILLPEKIQLVDFRVVKNQVDSSARFSAGKVEGHELNFGFDLGFNLKDKLVKAEFRCEISAVDKQAESAEGQFHLVFIYHVENLEELAILDKENKITLFGGLGNALASITYSTSRGILMTRLQDTAFQGFILPVINPDELLSKSRWV